jgi:thioredoxin 1
MVVVGFCAAWCHVCKEFEPSFRRLAAEFPGSRFVWLDIEDQSEVVGDIEVENFPTLAVFHGDAPVHFGITEPQEAIVRRLLQALAAGERRSIEVPQAVLTLPERLAARGR